MPCSVLLSLLLLLPITASPLLDRPPPTTASGLFPPPRVMTPAQRLAQVHERSGVCNGTVVVASCWGFDPEDSTEFLQAALDSGARKVIVPPMCDDSYADCPVTQSTGDHRWVTLPLFLRSNQVVVFQTGVQLWAKRWEYVATGDSVLNLEEVANVDIVGYVRLPHPTPLTPGHLSLCRLSSQAGAAGRDRADVEAGLREPLAEQHVQEGRRRAVHVLQGRVAPLHQHARGGERHHLRAHRLQQRRGWHRGRRGGDGVPHRGVQGEA